MDRASWQIKIRGESASLIDASEALSAATSRLRERLKASGFEVGSLRLSGIASGKHYETERDTRVLKGYYAERASVVEISDLSRRQALETVLLADDHIEIVKVELRSSKHEDLRKQASREAVVAAKEKATALSKEAGAEIGTLLSIREGANNHGWIVLTENRVSDPFFGVDNNAEFEKLQYTATVTMKLELK